MLSNVADYCDESSLAYRLRRRRFGVFLKLLDALPRPVSILDVGGTESFWQMMGLGDDADVEVTLLNLGVYETTSPHIISVEGDARDLSRYDDGEFDVVFSNSVIEHVGTFDDQMQMAREIRRVGRSYFVQTPNRYFPIEPHFQFPCMQFLPLWMQVRLLCSFPIGAYPRATSRDEAHRWAAEFRLLSRRQFQKMFPQARLLRERLYGLTKSFMAVYYDEAMAHANSTSQPADEDVAVGASGC